MQMRMIMIIVIIVYLGKASLHPLTVGCFFISMTMQMSKTARKNVSLS